MEETKSKSKKKPNIVVASDCRLCKLCQIYRERRYGHIEIYGCEKFSKVMNNNVRGTCEFYEYDISKAHIFKKSIWYQLFRAEEITKHLENPNYPLFKFVWLEEDSK